MAKGKHSAALFEVIKSQNRPDKAAQSLRTPKWWFKGRQTPKAAPAEPPSFREPEPEPRRAERRDERRESAGSVRFDRRGKQVTLNLRYTTAVAGAFGVLAVAGGAYVIGRHLSSGPQRASAGETAHVQQLMQQPPQPSVTQLIRPRPAVASETQTGPATPPAPHGRDAVAPKTHESAASLVPAGVETGMPRAIGLNYVVIQSYPPQEETAAKEAAAYLNRSGIPCTIEPVPAYNPRKGWVCLVGTAGFVKVHSREFETYVSNINRLAANFHTSQFDKFDPHPFKWKG